MLGRVRRRRGKSEDLDGPVVASGGEELISRIEGDALDMALVHSDCLELLKGVAGPDNNLGVQTNRNED